MGLLYLFLYNDLIDLSRSVDSPKSPWVCVTLVGHLKKPLADAFKLGASSLGKKG
jgi:hypothetical protein